MELKIWMTIVIVTLEEIHNTYIFLANLFGIFCNISPKFYKIFCYKLIKVFIESIQFRVTCKGNF